MVDATDVVFSYGQRQVLNGVSMHIPKGEIYGILGANGAGKTTLIRLMAGLLKTDGGQLTVFGEKPSSRTARNIGYMPQLNALYLELSAEQNVDFFARMFGLSNAKERREAEEAVLDLVGLWERRKDAVLSLSGGMRQRVSLAIAMVHQPLLLILDEPTVGLDPELRASFWDHFRSLAASGVTLVLSSHTMDDAAHCHRLAFLQEGRVIAEGSPSELSSAAGIAGASLEDAFLHFVRLGQ
ncbi:MAG: ABC transporter ATP-binding protein [SAR202 cluster bacterium Casp-Chloro-G2]|nr:MAG: ABC transporter ATP-binding protein [SAR202 cluster bacterium Casp-Chloro-G2]